MALHSAWLQELGSNVSDMGEYERSSGSCFTLGSRIVDLESGRDCEDRERITTSGTGPGELASTGDRVGSGSGS